MKFTYFSGDTKKCKNNSYTYSNKSILYTLYRCVSFYTLVSHRLTHNKHQIITLQKGTRQDDVFKCVAPVVACIAIIYTKSAKPSSEIDETSLAPQYLLYEIHFCFAAKYNQSWAWAKYLNVFQIQYTYFKLFQMLKIVSSNKMYQQNTKNNF